MSDRKTDYSIKSKILASLIAIPFVMLTLLLIWSLQIFQKDKIAYIFDATGTISSSLSTQISTKLKQSEEQAKLIIENLDSNLEWKIEATKLFSNYETIEALTVINIDEGSKIEKVNLSSVNNLNSENPIKSNKKIVFLERRKDLVKIAIESNSKLKIWIAELEKNSNFIDFNEEKDFLYFGFIKKPYKVILLLNPKSIIASIRKPGPFIIALLNKSNQLLISTEGVNRQSNGNLPLAYQDTSNIKTVKNKTGEEYLIAYSSLQEFPMMTLAAAIKKSDALSVVQDIVKKSLLIFVLLLACSIIIGVFLTEEITSSLEDILGATKKITEGFFNIKIRIRRDDEVGAIAKSINIMAIEIKRLLKETEDKVRMQHELKVAQVLQATFFPKDNYKYPHCQVVGKFEPASECSGDWWYHMELNGKIYFFIGDATGHGVSAALLTGTVFTALKIIFENTAEINEVVSKLNEIIFRVYQGQIMMTFLLAEYSPETRTLKYVNASHDPAFILRKSSQKLSRKNLDCLNEELGPRLGEREQYDYSKVEITLTTGDRIFFYTDGIFDIKNKKLEALTERNFHQFLIDCHFVNIDLKAFNDDFYNRLKDFQHIASHDDITFFTIEAG